MKRLFSILVVLFVIFSCDQQPEDDKDNDTGFDISKDIIDIPSSLLPSSTSRSASNPSEAAVIYDLIPEYIKSAENIRSMVEEIVVDLIKNKDWLDSVERDTAQEITGDENFVEYIVEDISGDYETRITLNSEAGSLTPMMVVDFYMDDDTYNTRGKIILKRIDEYSGTPTDISLEKEIWAEITFDGISETKTLDIYYYQPMGDIDSNVDKSLIGYARSLDKTVEANKTILKNLDLGQPERISLKITFDGDYYRVSGYSYHPGLDTMHDKDLDVFYELFNPEDQSKRHTYLFKGIAGANTSGDDVGAKLYLSFPQDTITDTTDVWTKDALGEFYGDYLTTVANSYINDPDGDGIELEDSEYGEALLTNMWIQELFPTYTDGDTVDETKWNKFGEWTSAIKTGIVDASDLDAANMYVQGLEFKDEARVTVKKDDIYLLARFYNLEITSASAPFSSETWASFKDYFYSESVDYEKLYHLSTISAEQANSYLADDSKTDKNKEWLLTFYEFTSIVDELVPTTFEDFSMTREELEEFLNSDDLSDDARDFAELYESLNYIVNPALYHATDKFLGTYNTETQEYYELSDSLLVVTDSPSSNMEKINGYNGTSINTLVPNTQKNYVISFP